MNDCVAKVDTMDEAKSAWEKSLEYDFYHYHAQILDVETGEGAAGNGRTMTDQDKRPERAGIVEPTGARGRKG
jgi:hypothetical protein